MAKNPPTVRMRRLGVELRKLREERNLTLDEAAELLSLSKSALNRMENAQVITRAHEVKYFIMMYEVTDKARRDALLGLTSAGRSKDWVKRYGALSPDSSVGWASGTSTRPTRSPHGSPACKPPIPRPPAW